MKHVEENTLAPLSFAGTHGGLVPLALEHHDALVDAVAEDDLWALWYTAVPSPDGMRAEIERRLSLQANGEMLPFTILDSAGIPVGMTTYMALELAVPRLEIGYTWYGRRVQRTALNTECKLLLLTHAFEQLGCLAVEFRTSFFNQQSRRAIERLGAKLDGVLRQHRRHPDGSMRDTCVYSILDSEWPGVRQNLCFSLQRKRSANALSN
ncbi:MAG: GNAT family N-acetyltransferase [Congregibacter sp.]